MIMKNFKTTFGAAIISTAAILATSSALAATDLCKPLTDAQYAKLIQGSWHLTKPVRAKNKHYDMHLALTQSRPKGGNFHAYMDEVSHPDNQMITADGIYNISNGKLDFNVLDANVPIDNASGSITILCMSKTEMNVQYENETITLKKES